MNFTQKYFETLLNEHKGRFVQSVVFEGMDVHAQLEFALFLARKLNCLKSGEDECTCYNCNWIREENHPAVQIVSQNSFKPQGDETKTVISTKQAQAVAKALEQTSEYHRVFIFLDEKTPKNYETLNYKSFHPKAPNALLKSVEEPPERTTFFFLTKTREDLMSTIVSRSQVFKMPSKRKIRDVLYIEKFLSDYPNITLEKAFDISLDLQGYIKENETNPKLLLDDIQQWLWEKGCSVYDIRLIEKAKKRLDASMSPKNVLDALFIEMSKARSGTGLGEK